MCGLIKVEKFIKEIGKVFFRKNKKLKRLSIIVNNRKLVTVNIPYGVTYFNSEKFVLSKVKWIKKQQTRLSKKYILSSNLRPSDLEIVNFKKKITEKINLYSKINRLFFKKLNFRWMRSRWGSCSAKNNITINYWAMYLPSDLIKYIILHELTHIKIKSHNQLFWIELEKICKDSKLLNKRLKNEFSI